MKLSVSKIRQLSLSKNQKFPPGLMITFGLALGPAVALGLARFAYALLLPSMRADLHWSFTLAGAMNTANAIGYLIGALLAAIIASRYGIRHVFIASFGITVLLLLATAGTSNSTALVILRALAGIFGAIVFITGAGLVATVASKGSPHWGATLLGIYFAGGGAGIIASGLGIPYLLSVTSLANGWRWGWVFLAVLGAIAFIIATRAALDSSEPPSPHITDKRWPARNFVTLLASYGTFGVGYIAYMTFIIAFLKSYGGGPGEITVFWVVLGTASIAGAFAWAIPISKLHGKYSLSIVLTVLSIGALLPLVSQSPEAIIGSALLFGGSFLSVVTAVTTVARKSLQPHHWTPAIAGLTVAFSLGQCLGPILAGAVSNGSSGLRIGLTWSVGVLFGAAFIALIQPRYETLPFNSIPNETQNEA